MYHIIINPNSKSGFGEAIWKDIEPILRSNNIEYAAFLSQYAGHIIEEVKRITSDGQHHNLIVVGGDGTLNEVVNGITDFSLATVGYIPTGSSNDFSRSLKLPSSPEDALKNILSSKKRIKVDVGITISGENTRHFLVSNGIGFDALITYQVAASPFKKIFNKLKIGKLIYAFVALQQLALYKPVPAKIILDDLHYINCKKNFFVVAMNTPYEGGGLKFCPDANFTDKKLNICIVSDLPKLKILALLPLAFFGKHVGFKGADTYTCERISISTKTPRNIHTDGEHFAITNELHVSCAHEPLEFIC